MVVVAVAHLWGVGLYFLTGGLEGERWCSQRGVYRWGYFWGLNAPWVLVSLAVVGREVGRLGSGGRVGEGVKRE